LSGEFSQLVTWANALVVKVLVARKASATLVMVFVGPSFMDISFGRKIIRKSVAVIKINSLWAHPMS
jgi:hypothetical protein